MKRIIRAALLALPLALLGLTSMASHANAADFESGGNTWPNSRIGDWVEYAMQSGLGVRIEVTTVADNGDITFKQTTYNADGSVSGENSRTREPAACPVQVRVPANTEVTWDTAEYDMGLVCQTAAWISGDINMWAWFSADVPCGGVVMTGTGEIPTVWLSAYGRDGKTYSLPEPEPEPEPEPQPAPEAPAALPDFGDPINMMIPESVQKAMKDQGIAITRMHLYMEEQSSKSGAVLEYEGMRTEVPVIYAAFKGDQCDQILSYTEWKRRDGRFVDLAFEVKSVPKVLEGMKVKIKHAHLQGETETELSTFEVDVPEAGKPWESLRLRGALPGINRYSLLVSYTNAAGVETTQKGFSHWVIVHAPPMFEFENAVSATTSRVEAGRHTAIEADIQMTAHFLMHHGLDAKDCTLRISRQGERVMNLAAVEGKIRRVLNKEKVPPGWQEVARVKFSEGKVGQARVVTIEGDFVRVNWQHALAANAAVLPLGDHWEYRFELLHKDAAVPLATWSVEIDLDIKRPADLDTAKLVVRATGRKDPLSVGFTRK